jgi:glycine cleavage system H protein
MELEYPEDLKYLDSHEYVRLDGEIATIGVSAFAIDQLGDIVFLELPEVGDSVEMGEVLGTIESVKAVEDLYPPVSGTVIERNETAIDAPETLAEDPYGEGWLIKVRVDNPDDELPEVLSAAEYRAQVEGMEDT